MDMNQNNSIETEATRMKSLACAPGMIFILVASADGEIDKKELKRFATLMASKEYAILASMLEQAGATISDLLDEVLTKNLDPYQELQTVCSILDVYLSAQAAQAYKVTLLQLAKGIAKPADGFLGLFSRKMNQEEQTTITVVASLLGLLEDTQKQSTKTEETVIKSEKKTDYASIADLPDTVYPALKSADWAKKVNADAVTRSVYQQGESAEREPVIAYAVDSPEMVEFLSATSIHETLTTEQIHQQAMTNLEKRLKKTVKWNELDFDTGDETVGTVKGLVLNGDYYCSEAILSQAVLNQAHQQLETDLLMAVAPVRGELYITKLVSEDQPEPDRLMFAHFAVSRYFNSQQVQISPNVWLIRNGEVAGYLAGMDKIIETAKQCSQPSSQEEQQLVHTAKTYSEDKGMGIEIDVVAKDLGIMMSDLEQVIRTYVDQGVKQKSFSGKLRVHLDIQDPGYGPEMKTYIAEQLASMNDFLCHQFTSLGIKTVNDADIKLSFSVIN